MSPELPADPNEYKRHQQKRIAEFMVGNKDYSGDKITHILRKSDEYVIYEISTKNPAQSIRVQIDTIIENDDRLSKLLDEINADYIKLKGLMYKCSDLNTLKYQMAHCVALALNGNADHAKQQIRELISEINQEHSDQFSHRIRYLITVLLTCLILVILSVTAYYYNFLNSDIGTRNFLFICAAGTIGCTISISRRLRKTVFEKGVNSGLYVLYGLERVCISIFGAMIVFFANKANLLFGFVNELTNPLHGFILFGIVAGFSETLIPNLLVKLEKKDASS